MEFEEGEVGNAHRERDVGELDTSTSAGALRGPILVDVEAICRPTCNETVENDIADVA